MIFRLILVLLLALAAVPAPAAACHPPAQAQGHGSPHHQPQGQDEALAPHACIGCAPASDWLRARLDEPRPESDAALVAHVARLSIGSGVPPALPPPRAA